MSLAMKLRELRWRAAGHYSRPLDASFVEPLRGARALELGGPSAVFRSGGLLPAYSALATLDCVQAPGAHSLWHGEMREGEFDPGEPGLTGRLWLAEAGDLAFLPAASYDAILSSHVLEHLANPVGALRGWLRVLRPGGHVLTVLPHKEGCADHRRPTTALEHMIEDERARTPESDLTHADEVIALHDLRRDPVVPDHDALERRVRDNPRTRALHHHVFTTRSALRLLDHLGLKLLLLEVRWPHDIYVLARARGASEPPADNSTLLGGRPAALADSPFRSDRNG